MLISTGTKRGPGSYPTRQSTNKVERKHRFRIHIPVDIKKIIQVKLCSDCHKEIDGYELKKIPDTDLWEVEVICSLPERLFNYYYAIECDASLHIPFMDWKFFKNTKMHITRKIFSEQSDLYLAFASQDYKHVEDAYYSHCYYIIKSVIDGQESRFMKEMDEMKRFSSHLTIDQRKNIIISMIHTVLKEDLTKKGNCMVFVSLVVQLYPYMDLRANIPSDFARKILHQCTMVSKECDLKREEVYLRVFEMIYIAADNDQANLLSFFNCMYPLYNVDMFTKLLSDHNKGTRSVCSVKSLHGDIEPAKCILKTFVKRLSLQAEEDEKSKTLQFVEKLQRILNFDLQIVVCETLMQERALCDTSLDILQSACEIILVETSKRGDILGVTKEWEKMKRCPFISCEKIQAKVEKCILESFDKATENQMRTSYAKLKEICINGSLFSDTDTKLKLMRKFAASPSREVHLLVAECLLQKRFQEIPEKDADEIVLSWFEYACKRHCGFNHTRKQLSGFLTSLYAYYSEVVFNPWLSTHTELLENLEKRTFEYLKEEDILEIIKAMPEIEMWMQETTDDLFRAHIQALVQEGLESGDINKQDLFGQTKYCVVNSRMTLQYFLTLMECSGLKSDMGLEDALSIILSGHHLWRSILTASGKKENDIHENKFAVKAREMILDLKQAIEKEIIQMKFLIEIENRKKICLELISVASKAGCEKVEKRWSEISANFKAMKQSLGYTLGVFQEAKKRIKLDLPQTECVLACLKFFEEMQTTLNEGCLNIADARQLLDPDGLVKEICDHCQNLKEVVKSYVYWNISFQHFHELDVQIDTQLEDEMETSFGIAFLFEENEETDTDNVMKLNLQKGCRFLWYLSAIVFKKYHEFWFPLLSGTDAQISTIQKNLENSNVMEELELAQSTCKCQAISKVKNALKKYSEFETQNEKVTLMKSVLNAFEVDFANDQNFQEALSEYEKLLEGHVENLTVFQIGTSLMLVGNVVDMVDSDMVAVLQELQKSSVLIEFLKTVVDEDIRNLIDAVEEHSEQYVRESTVSDLIEVKRFIQPFLKQKYDKNVNGFFSNMKKSLETSGIKNLDKKIYECSSNLHSLKALYNHVANRGEHTREIVENIVHRGKFNFCLKENECDVVVEYKQDKKTHSYSKAYMNDLRSRALLMINTEDKQQGKAPTSPNKKEYLSSFIEIIDCALDISQMCFLLKEAGHFQFARFDQKKRKEQLGDLLVELKSMYSDWCKILTECRRKFYLMNYIHSDQLQMLYNFAKDGKGRDSVITILRFINPGMTNLEHILDALKLDIHVADKSPQKILEALGEIFENLWKNLNPKTERMFDKKASRKFSEIVQAGRLYVAALEPDSQFVVRTLLALHRNTTQKVPLAHNVLLCNKSTSSDDITLLLNRCLGCKNDQLFTVANIEMLTPDTQDYLIDKLREMQSNSSYLLALLCRGNSHHPFLERFADHVMRPKPITENELKEFLKQNYPNMLTITSDVPGLGKSEEVQRIALRNDIGKITLHVSGLFEREKIVEQLTKLTIKPYHVLHIDVGPVDEPSELDAFLFELIVLRYVSARKFAFALNTNYICVEISNSVNQDLSNSLPTMTCFKREHLIWDNYKSMHISQEINSPVQVVCHYLQLLDSGQLDQTDVYLTGKEKSCPLSSVVCRNILQKHLSTSGNLSYTIVNIFLGVLADQLKKLSSSVFFRTSNIQHQTVKSELVLALKNMSTDFSSRSINACRSTQLASMSVMGSSEPSKQGIPLTCAEVLAKRTEGMVRWEDSNHLMVLFHHDLQTVSALYRNKDKVPKQISNLFESQLKKKLEDFGCKTQDELQSILLKLVQHPSEVDSALSKISKDYALTPDNLLKMVLIILRLNGHQPVVIMGETGCGKTSLVRFLSVVCQVDFLVLSIHAGVTEETIERRVRECDIKAKANFKRRIWLFLDEINTCDHLGLICDIVCHHRCKGALLSPNLKILAACNPYRLRSDKSILTSGLQGKVKTDQLSKLVYRVQPLPETMIDYVWDYGSLKREDEKAYIERMVQGVFKSRKYVDLLVNLLTMSQQFVQEEEGSDCCVSLRDVERCRKLVVWFLDILKKKNESQSYVTYRIQKEAIILALSICYHSRFPDNDTRKRYRQKVAHCCKMIPELHLDEEEKIENIIIGEQNDILNRMELPLGTAKNTALRENVFVILVCILNRIPVFVVGKPGCSKSLSMQLIRSNLRGKDSGDRFFKSLPHLYCVSFQGSESSTSDGIIKVFEKAKKYQNHSQVDDIMSVVILDEIGLAEISRFNPLKVLHSLLEPENQTAPDVAVVGISNWALDAAKMNRAIHLSRPEMDEKELYQTALSITESLMSRPETSQASKFSIKKGDKGAKMTTEIKDLLRKLANSYFLYNKKQQYKNFHGLRDFYSLTKYIGKGILVDKQDQIDCVIVRGLLRNLGGLSSELKKSMLSEFEQCLQAENHPEIGVLELIQDNLMDRQSRHLMLITNGDAVLSVLEDKIKDMKRQHVVIFGSQFEEDLTDDYNYRILSRIILCMEQGYVLILKDLENIYGSLYDMLNQNYTVVGSKKNCRVALGPYSNPMCHVHEDFKCIVLVEESKLDYSDPPFLNRFEKQQFRFEDMMDEKAICIKNKLKDFIQDFCECETYSFQPADVFAISGENILSSLVLKIQKEENSDEKIINIGQNELLWITTPEAVLRLRISELWKTKSNTVKRLENDFFGLPIHGGLFRLLSSLDSGQDEENNDCWMNRDRSLVAVFTYDTLIQPIHGTESSQMMIEKLGNFKSEKHLSRKVQHFFDSDLSQLILHCNLAEDFEHILLAKSTIENCKRDNKMEETRSKNVCLVCHLERQELKQRTVTQINFLSGWKLAMLDTLYEPRMPLTKMVNMSVMEVIQGRRPMTDTIREHIFWAFTTVQYVGTGHTAEKMMKIIRDVQDSERSLVVLEELVYSSICKAAEKYSDKWQRNVACDKHALLKGSCYMNALEQYLLDLIKKPLCKIIFKLEEANALESIFYDDGRQIERFSLWRNLTFKESFMDIVETPDPSGPECYTCSSKRLTMILPFSFVVMNRIEKTKDDFLNTLKQLRISCNLDEDEEIPIELFRELVSKYKDIVEQDLTDYIEVDYSEKFSEYQHDFGVLMTPQKATLDDEERVKIMKWSHDIFGKNDLCNDFTMQVTHLHVLNWLYSSVVDSIIQVLGVVKEKTDVSIDEILHNTSEQNSEVNSDINDSVETMKSAAGDEEIQEGSSIIQVMGIVNDETFHNASEQNFEENSDVNDPVENMKFAAGNEEIQEVSSESSSEEDKRKLFVDRLCKIFLPTTKLMTSSSVQKWQYLVSGVLPLFAEISLDPPSVHMLRFCSDISQAILALDGKDAVQLLSTFGDRLCHGVKLQASEMFKLMMSQIESMQEGKEVGVINPQRCVCQYLWRCLAINPEQNPAVEWFLSSVADGSLSNTYLKFFSPILEIIIDMENENEDELCNLIGMNSEDLDEEGYLHVLHCCIDLHCTNGDPDTNISSLLVTIFQDIYGGMLTVENLEAIGGNSDELLQLAFKATTVLQNNKGCSLSLVASVGYLQSLLKAYVSLLRENQMNGNAFPIITKTINAILETGDEENLFRTQRTQCLLVYFLKVLHSAIGMAKLNRRVKEMEECLPVLKALDWNTDFISKSLIFHPVAQYEDDKSEFEHALLQMEEREEKNMKALVDTALHDSQKMFCFVGCLANTFYLQSQLTEMSDTKRIISGKIFEMLQNDLPKTQCRIVELFLKVRDFAHSLFNSFVQSPAADTQIVSVLTHLLSLIIFKGETGNLWYDIVTDVADINSKYLPGVTVVDMEKSSEYAVELGICCKTRFCSSEKHCPQCSAPCETDAHTQKASAKKREVGYEKPTERCVTSGFLSSITCHFFQFFIHGCITLSLAAELSDADKIRKVLHVEEEPEDRLTDILHMKWEHMKSLTQLNDDELCTLVHVVIHKMPDLFTKGNAPYACKTEEDCEHLERDFQACLNDILREKFKCITRARQLVCKKNDIDLSSLECQIQEISVIDEPQEKELMLPRLFRMTSPVTKDAMIAQIFFEDNHKRYPFLSFVLKNEDILTLPKFILPILRWHQSTVSIGSYKMKKVDCKEETIEKFFRMENDETRRRLLKKRFEEFITSWNELITKHGHFLKSSLSEEDNMSHKNKVISCIITDESSVIQNVLLELVEIHNYIVDTCLKIASTSDAQSLNFLMCGDQQSKTKSTSLWELSSRDIISVTWDDKILRFSQCNTEFGEGKDRCYDLHKIESEIAYDLILGKPYISVPSTFPRILFVDELFQNTIQLLESIRMTIPQERIPDNVLKGLLKKKESDSSQIPELMTVLGMSLSLLKKTKGDPSLPLAGYLENWKDIALFHKGYKRLLPEPEDAVKLCHVVNLYIKLEELNGEIILDTLDLKYKDNIPPEGRGKLETIGDNYISHLEVLGETLKVFIHRCLTTQDNNISLDQQLLDYIKDKEFWPYGNLEDEQVSVKGQKKKLSDIVCTTLRVKHIYHTVRFILDFVEEKQAMYLKISPIAASYGAQKDLDVKARKMKNVKKKFGKT
ncbi:uncharacterized protein LOC125646740 isoform X2 [Ostrea edulis]|uniref:uncharacterized protein LOC125646740 isoform X2 n=1 Tax=Ostrea edulis TaxID=37623 RepID=UPI0024AEA793|nr:uncharacterized protein LOC125646740 isoform X2 [Ostrea edulis]